jgi:hypothetical protein
LSSGVAWADVGTVGEAPFASPPVDAPAPIVALDTVAHAREAEQPDRIPVVSALRRHIWGASVDAGVPDGAAFGLSARPQDWLRLGASATHNGMAPGVRLSVTLDPIPAPVGLTLTIEGGHSWSGTVPGAKSAPSIGYNYANFHAGLEFGNRSSFRFFLHGGVSWLDLSGAAAQNATGRSASGLASLSYSGWIAPSAKLGFSLYL